MIRHARLRWAVLHLLCATLALGLTGCMFGAGARDGFAPLTFFDNFRTIEPQAAYRSAQLDGATLRLVVQTYGIRTIINLRGDNTGESWYDTEKAVAEEFGVAHVDVRFSAESLPSREELLKLYDAFATAEYPILIHCKAGADRTGAAAAIWRMQMLGEARDEADRELSLAFGHVAAAYPDMDRLVRMFENDREWIVSEYPGPELD
ncbi:MAG: tyrosine-protein phosphatase [Planctomycetota bacterium]